jgi:RHS repeat-associated protein
MNRNGSKTRVKEWIKNTLIVSLSAIILSSLLFVDSAGASSNVQKIRHSLKPMDLSKPLSTEEIKSAGLFGGLLHPTHAVNDTKRDQKINHSFAVAIQTWNKTDYKQAVQLLKQHIEEYPDSPWASQAIFFLGNDAQYNGRYSEAEERFQWIVENNKGKSQEGAKILTNKARLHLAVFKADQHNYRGARDQFRDLKKESPDWRDRTYASHWLQRLSRYTSNETALLSCGTQALAYLLEKDGRTEDAKKVAQILPDDIQGHSMKALTDIALQHGRKLSAVKLTDSSELTRLPLPAIVHIEAKNQGDLGHYWILERVSGKTLDLYDPQVGRRFTQTIDEFRKEWSSHALLFSNNPNLQGVILNDDEMNRVHGGCLRLPIPEDNTGAPGPNGSPNGSPKGSCGSPTWSANMVSLNLYVKDVPLWYTTPIGPSVEIALSYNSQSALNNYEPFGNKWQFNYATYLVEDTSGGVIIFMPDGRRDTYQFMNPDGIGLYSHAFQVHNTLTKIAQNHFELKLPDDTVYVYSIPQGTASLQPLLTEMRDAHGQKLTFGYNSDVQLITITDASGRISTLTYNAAGLVSRVTDPFGRWAAFEYDDSGNLLKITDMGGYGSNFTYDADKYVTSIGNQRDTWGFTIEPSDGVTGVDWLSPVYPAPGAAMGINYRITITDPAGGKEELFYFSASSGGGPLPGETDPLSGQQPDHSWYVGPKHYIPYQSPSINNYRSKPPKIKYLLARGIPGGMGQGQKGAIQKIVFPEGGFVEYTYDMKGNRSIVADSHGHTNLYEYNDMGRITSFTDAKSEITTLTYAANGVDLTQIHNDGLGTLNLSYNGAPHEITSITDRLGNPVNIGYNGYGQITSLTNAGIVTNYVYDEHRLQQVVRDSKTVNSYTYDSIGRIKTSTDATGLTVTFDYNNMNYPTKITYPDGKFLTFNYSSAGCCPRLLDSITDRSGRATYYTYDFLKRLTETKNPDGGITKYSYDPNGNLIELIDPIGTVTGFQFDNDNRLTKKTYTDGKYVSFAYDNMGLLASRTNARGLISTYTYDQNHNLLGVSYSDDTPGVTYQYDDYNRIVQRQDGIGTHLYSYDANSRLISIDGPWTNDTLTYGYDAIGRLTSLQPQGGQAVSYGYDGLNRLTAVQSGTNTHSYAYAAANPLIQTLSRPNGSATTYQYDSLNRLTGISSRNSASDIINQYVYAYNEQDMRSGETVTTGEPIAYPDDKLVTYDYNQLNQLVGSGNPDKTFAYDADGNMTRGYTPEGYLFAATYDAEDRLASVEYTDGDGKVQRTQYFYGGNHFPAKVKEFENGSLAGETIFVRDGLLVLQERDGANRLNREYTWGLDMGGGIGGLLNLRQEGQDYSYLYDGKGNVAAILDQSQSIAASYAYDPFGNLLSKTGFLNQPYQFSTKHYDEKTGFSYYGYRFYSPGIGRWINRDPLEEAGGINLYAFVGNNPVDLVDPDGQSVSGAIVAGAAIVGGVLALNEAASATLTYFGSDPVINTHLPLPGGRAAMVVGGVVITGSEFDKLPPVIQESTICHEWWHKNKQSFLPTWDIFAQEIDARIAEKNWLKKRQAENRPGDDQQAIRDRINEIRRDLAHHGAKIKKAYPMNFIQKWWLGY